MQLMKEGAKWELYIKSELAYGDRGAGGLIPGGSVLIFEMGTWHRERAAVSLTVASFGNPDAVSCLTQCAFDYRASQGWSRHCLSSGCASK